jgi:predicted  nucleic acid-binding Zn-ribbon protein
MKDRLTTLEFKLQEIELAVAAVRAEVGALNGRQDRTETEVSFLAEESRARDVRDDKRDAKIDRLSGELHLVRENQEAQNKGVMTILFAIQSNLQHIVARLESGGEVPWTPNQS